MGIKEIADEVNQDVNIVDPIYIPSQTEIKNYNASIKPKLFQLAMMIRDGAQEEDILSYLMISKLTFYRYKRFFPELRNAVVEGKLCFVERAEKALNDLATGITYEEVETVDSYSCSDGDSEDGSSDTGEMKLKSRKVRKTKKYIPPNFNAVQMILTNKDAENWKKQVPDNLTQNNNVVQLNVSEEDLKTVMDKMNNLTK